MQQDILSLLPYIRVDSPLKDANCSQACCLQVQICGRPRFRLLALNLELLFLHERPTASNVHQEDSGQAFLPRHPGVGILPARGRARVSRLLGNSKIISQSHFLDVLKMVELSESLDVTSFSYETETQGVM